MHGHICLNSNLSTHLVIMANMAAAHQQHSGANKAPAHQQHSGANRVVVGLDITL